MSIIDVTVKFKRNGTTSVNPFRVKIKYNKADGTPDDRVRWISRDTPMDVLFNKNGTPFTGVNSIAVPTTAGGATSPAPTKNQKLYLYTMVLYPVDGPAITIDPEVDVDGGGPPPKKKSAKGKGKNK
jgi:hypothetical protein